MEILVGLALLAPAIWSTVPAAEKPKPKKSNSFKKGDIIVFIASTEDEDGD